MKNDISIAASTDAELNRFYEKQAQVVRERDRREQEHKYQLELQEKAWQRRKELQQEINAPRLGEIGEVKRQFDVNNPAQSMHASPSSVTPEKIFDPKSGLYFNTEDDFKAYQAAHPPTPPQSKCYDKYLWIIIFILVIAVIGLMIRDRKPNKELTILNKTDEQ
jgi:hypothetical protein